MYSSNALLLKLKCFAKFAKFYYWFVKALKTNIIIRIQGSMVQRARESIINHQHSKTKTIKNNNILHQEEKLSWLLFSIRFYLFGTKRQMSIHIFRDMVSAMPKQKQQKRQHSPFPPLQNCNILWQCVTYGKYFDTCIARYQ